MDELGTLLGQSQPGTTPDNGLAQQWKGWMDNPANKAGLLSFGLQMMVGGYGGLGSQMGVALGKGVESAAATQENIQQESDKKAAIGRAQANLAAEMNLKRELNNADNAAALERAKLAHGAGKADQDLRKKELAYNALLRLDTTLGSKRTDLIEKMGLAVDDSEKTAFQTELANIDKQRELLGKRMLGFEEALGLGGGIGNGGAETSGNSSIPKGSVGLPPGTEMPATGQRQGTSEGAPKADKITGADLKLSALEKTYGIDKVEKAAMLAQGSPEKEAEFTKLFGITSKEALAYTGKNKTRQVLGVTVNVPSSLGWLINQAQGK